MKEAAVGTFRLASSPDGRERILSYRFLPRWDVVVTANVPLDAALAPWRSRVRESVVIFTILGVAGAAAAAWAMVSAQRVEQTASDLARALGQKDNLLREMHHRVKNNLQMTMSLMRMSSRRMKSEPVRQLVGEMEERLRAMSLLFEMVYRSDLTGELSLRHYVTRLVDTIGTSFAAQEAGITIGVDCVDVRMDADRLGTVGLLVTEVMTNAMKHAFEGVAAPRIDLSITEADGRIEIVIADNGRGFNPEAGERRSLGMTMIDAFVQQLEGESRLESHGGTIFRASIPRDKPERRVGTPTAPSRPVGAA